MCKMRRRRLAAGWLVGSPLRVHRRVHTWRAQCKDGWQRWEQGQQWQRLLGRFLNSMRLLGRCRNSMRLLDHRFNSICLAGHLFDSIGLIGRVLSQLTQGVFDLIVLIFFLSVRNHEWNLSSDFTSPLESENF